MTHKKFKSLPSDRLEVITTIFSRLFEWQYRTKLIRGGLEPMYVAAKYPSDFHEVIFTCDYISSALHECAHWCVAGAERRKLDDYGYWYAPDGRSELQQLAFEKVEVRPQSLERIFSYAVGQPFRVSADNLDLNNRASPSFLREIHSQTIRYCEEGLPRRARAFALALAEAFNCADPFCASSYHIDDLF